MFIQQPKRWTIDDVIPAATICTCRRDARQPWEPLIVSATLPSVQICPCADFERSKYRESEKDNLFNYNIFLSRISLQLCICTFQYSKMLCLTKDKQIVWTWTKIFVDISKQKFFTRSIWGYIIWMWTKFRLSSAVASLHQAEGCCALYDFETRHSLRMCIYWGITECVISKGHIKCATIINLQTLKVTLELTATHLLNLFQEQKKLTKLNKIYLKFTLYKLDENLKLNKSGESNFVALLLVGVSLWRVTFSNGTMKV